MLAPGDDPAPGPAAQTSARHRPAGPPGDSSPATEPSQIAIAADQVRIVDPPGGDRDRAARRRKGRRRRRPTAAGTPTSTSARSSATSRPAWASYRPRRAAHGQVGAASELSAAGASAELYSGTTTRPATTAGDQELFRATVKTPVGAVRTARRHDHDVQRLRPGPGVPLPAALDHRAAGHLRRGFQVGVQEIIVRGHDPPPAGAGTARSGAWIDRRGRRGPTGPADQTDPAVPTAPPTTSDDAALLRAHVDGDPLAFATLVRRHRDRLWAVALRTLGDREEAADALQDALLSAYRGAGRFRGESAVTTWLHRIVVNACLDRLRRRQARPTVPLPRAARRSRPPGRAEPAAPNRTTTPRWWCGRRSPNCRPSSGPRWSWSTCRATRWPRSPRMLGVAEGTVKSRCARGRARLAVLSATCGPARRRRPP